MKSFNNNFRKKVVILFISYKIMSEITLRQHPRLTQKQNYFLELSYVFIIFQKVCIPYIIECKQENINLHRC
jgi:hypothetical protein